ncbi:hypothetical protein CYY_008224 [Polysphondylium violaceum]|uniref:Uncharacterized protein n=1 Tax=Polysphondylium violaceum TaxID=133409 RepID=A0A8J4PQQ4_9MYCE|nr:hypothetical protein CYY_008224 [Polysphondylium violaceum]
MSEEKEMNMEINDETLLSVIFKEDPTFLGEYKTKAIVFLLLFILLLLKTIYIFIFDSNNLKSKKPKRIFYSVSLLVIALICVVNFFSCFFPERISIRRYYQIKSPIENFSRLLAITSCVLVYFHWISILENDFKAEKLNRKRFSLYLKIIFLGVYIIPYLTICIVSILIFFMSNLSHQKYTIIKFEFFYLLITNSLAVLVLWGFLIYKFKTLDKAIINQIKHFFIIAFIFSVNQISFLIFNVVSFVYIASHALTWVANVNYVILFLELIFLISPVDFRLVYNTIKGCCSKKTTVTTHETDQNDSKTAEISINSCDVQSNSSGTPQL